MCCGEGAASQQGLDDKLSRVADLGIPEREEQSLLMLSLLLHSGKWALGEIFPPFLGG